MKKYHSDISFPKKKHDLRCPENEALFGHPSELQRCDEVGILILGNRLIAIAATANLREVMSAAAVLTGTGSSKFFDKRVI